MILRASDFPLLAKCQGAAYGSNDEVRLHRIDEYGAFGSAVHEACAHIVRSEEFATDEILYRHGLGPKERPRFLWQVGVAWRWWQAHEQDFCRDDGTLRVLDWKTTRLQDVQYDPQLRQYLYLLLNDFVLDKYQLGELCVEREVRYGDETGHPDAFFVPTKVERCQYAIVFLDDDTHVISEGYSPSIVMAQHTSIIGAITIWPQRQPPEYCDGGHCRYCGRLATCPGLQHKLAHTYTTLMKAPGLAGTIAFLEPDEKLELWERTGLAIAILQNARDIIKAEAIAGGNQLSGSRRRLVIQEQKRKPLKPMAAWPVLKRHLTDDELAPAVNISKEVVLGAVAAKYQKGEKGKARKRVEEELNAAGAFDETTVLFPRLVPAQGAAHEKQIEEK